MPQDLSITAIARCAGSERGYTGAYTAAKRLVSAIRLEQQPKPFEVDFARFVTTFTVSQGSSGSSALVLGHSRHISRASSDLQTLLRCHMLAFAPIGGVPIEIR